MPQLQKAYFAHPVQVHIMVAHSGKTWCRCGTCNQEFCEDDKTLPAKLTIGKEETSEEENQNSNPQGGGGGGCYGGGSSSRRRRGRQHGG
ncbi:hypothetical protein AAHC03_09344 [Spirometra sp. Aus1]